MTWFSKLTFSKKLYLGFSTILSLSVILSIIAFIELSNINKVNRELGDKWMPSIDTLRNMADGFDRYLLKEIAYMSTNKSAEKVTLRRELDSIRQVISNNQKAYQNLISGIQAEESTERFPVYEKAMNDFFKNSDMLIQMIDDGKQEEALLIRRGKERIKMLEDARKESSGLVKVNVKGGVTATKQTEENFNTGIVILSVVLGISIILGSIIAFFFSKDILAQVGGEPYQIAEITRQVSLGNLDVTFENKNGKLEGIYASVKQMVSTLKEVAEITNIISQGDTSKKVIVKSDNDILAISINEMIDNFKEQNQIKDGLNNLSKEISGNIPMIDIANKSVSFVARFLEIAQGVLYIYHKESQVLKLYGTFAFTERNNLSNQYKLGEGLIGQVALEKKEILLKNVTRQDAVISTGMIQESPLFILAFPLLYENELLAVIELASFNPFSESHKTFLNEASKIIATYLRSADQNDEVKRLLQIAEEAKAEAESKTLEVTEANAQLAQQQEELRAQAEELERANHEMEELNENLEERIIERTHEINQQKEEIEAQRDSLEQANSQLGVEKKKSDELLLNILPAEVAEELKVYGKTKTKYYRLTTVMFTDFKGFTQLASSMDGESLVSELNEVFESFDKVIDKYNLEKIKTIGDAYMCAGGLPVPNTSNPVDTVLAGLEIQRLMNDKYDQKMKQGENYWRLRLGIHSGEVIAGVIGKKKFAYDIWGDAVNSASRMESNGEVGKVNISQKTYDLVQDFFDCEYRGKTTVKGKGEMDMYFVTNVKTELSIEGEGIEPNALFYEKLEEFKAKQNELLLNN